MKAKKILLAGEAARELQICGLTLRNWVRDGRIRAERTSSGYHLFTSAEIERVKGERQGRKDSGAGGK